MAAINITFTSAQTTTWFTSFDEVKTEALHQNKLILISFSGSDWCVPCAKLERDLLSTDEFASLAAENFLLLKADFPIRKKNQISVEQRKHNEALAAIYNPKGTFPSIVIVDHLGNTVGYMPHPKSSTAAYIKALKELILPK